MKQTCVSDFNTLFTTVLPARTVVFFRYNLYKASGYYGSLCCCKLVSISAVFW